ncbi:MAG: TolC family protein [Melioribacteraceae bacterium]|nr:MAG: heavy metal efflux pump [Ignavibacteria bacterium]KAF0162523.1 MAG: heavy metal efflux pump [Ignavibacteria bacterium]MBX3008081.1 TolC family protein [Melioribacteraceae bacterium]
MLSKTKPRFAGNKLFVLFAIAILPLCIYGQTEIRKLSLNEAVEIGLKNNPEIKSATENISASKGRFWSGISLPLPEVGVSYEYAPVNSSLSNYSEKTLAVSQSFEFPSNYFLKGSKFNKEEEIAVYKLNMTERSIINQVKTSYYKVLAKQYQVKSAEENLVISEDFFKKAEIRQNVGEGTNLERLTAKVQYTEAQNNLEVAKNELTTAFAELNYSLGYGKQSYEANFNLIDTLVFVDHKISIEQIYKSLEETNPQIKIAELNYGIASIEKGLAWSSILPNLNLAYFKQTRDGNNGFYGASFGISVPLWFMFDQRGKIQEAVANQSISESELQLTKNEIALRIKSAFTDHENNLKQVKLYVNDILPQAEEIYRTAIKSYDAGELTYLEYLQAKQTLISSRNNYINVLFNHYQSVFRIEEIVGQNIIDKSELEK